MSSMGGRFSFPGVGAYSATKFALEGLSEALAPEVAPYGIKVLIVEPGAFRTGFNRRRCAAAVGAAGRVRGEIGPSAPGSPDSDGKQPGDPEKAAAAILTALAAEQTPLRLALGNDAADAIAAQLKSAGEEAAAWEAVSRGTDFDKE